MGSSLPCLLSSVNPQTPDWIAHGVLDSVVDSCFPFLAQIEKEVDQVEKYLYSGPDVPDSGVNSNPTKPKPPGDSTLDPIDEKGEDASISTYDEKHPSSPVKPQQRVKTARFRVSPLPISLHIRRARRFIKSLFSRTPTMAGVGEPWMEEQVNPAARTVFRMAKIRRLVTSLTRLLSTKAELIGQIRKRLATRGEWSLDSDPELYTHMGDILGQRPSRVNQFRTESRCSRPHSIPTAGPRSLRTDVGPVTPNIPHSTAYPGRQDEIGSWQGHHHLDSRQCWGCR